MSRILRSSQRLDSSEDTSSSSPKSNLVTIHNESIPSLKVTINLQPSILRFISLKNEFDTIVKRSQTPDYKYSTSNDKHPPNTTQEKIRYQDPEENHEEDIVVNNHHNSIPKIPNVDDEEISEDPFSSDDEIFQLESEINRALSSNVTYFQSSNEVKPSTTKSQPASSPIQSQRQVIPPPPPPPPPKSKEPDLSAYKPVPPNIKPLLQVELGRLNAFNEGDQSQSTEDELLVAEKLIFTLKDPLSATKIKLPIKSRFCIHFECFDFDTFCIFNKIPFHIQSLLKHDLSKKNLLRKKYAQAANNKNNNSSRNVNGQHKNQNSRDHRTSSNLNPHTSLPPPGILSSASDYVRLIENPVSSIPIRNLPPPSPSVPVYKCPLCDTKFYLNDLLISDSYNYFVKSTPKETEKIELFEMRLYKIIDDSTTASKRASEGVEDENIIILSDDEDEDDDDRPLAAVKRETKSAPVQRKPYYNDDETDEFNDSLDEELLALGNAYFNPLQSGSNPSLNKKYSAGKGMGSWDDPVTLD
ncbi:uncharacterized protein RJT21DRAFT_46761 [Scheffersomyces amazonensis]|uniref:uncharacterized protein n=1 Tax=Scheffersomyces amazonensis TaxID=1078765 RepID=UPI00315D51B3